jgi:hypothetical protein
MPKPTNTIGDRDFARRLYVGKRPYTQKMKGASNSAMDRIRRVPHSEAKKPYIGDDDYPEMEYWFTPWTPPPYKPPPPIDPNDPNDPDWPPVDGCIDGPVTSLQTGGGGITSAVICNPREKTPFLGCDFAQPFVPRQIRAGETAFAKLARRDDPVIGFTVNGPAKIIGRQNQALCTSAGQNVQDVPWANSPECTVILRAEDNLAGYKANQDGLILVVVTAHTQSGSSCSTDIWLQVCPVTPALEYDWISSGEEVAPSSYKIISVIGGLPPFKWQISGTGFSLEFPTTTSRTNKVLTNASACGGADITIEDGCGDVVEASLRSTGGSWVLKTDLYYGIGLPLYCAVTPGTMPYAGPVGADSICRSGEFAAQQGKQRIFHCYAQAAGWSDTSGPVCDSAPYQ